MIKPLGTRVLLRPIEEKKSEIILIEEKERTAGEVIEIGDDVSVIKVGQKAIFKKYPSFLPREIDGLFLIDVEDILAIVE